MQTLYFAAVVSSSCFFFPPLFSAIQIGCLPYFHTQCGLSANLECRSELCCMRLTETQDAKNCQKFAICAPSHNFVGLSSQLRHVSTLGRKNLLNINTSSTCPHNMVNFSPLTAEIGSLVCGTTPNFNRFRDRSYYCTYVAHWRPIKVARCLAISWAATVYTFSGALAP